MSTIPPFRHIFKERLHLYYTKKVFIIQTILELFLSLSGKQWSRPTHNSTCANCLADSPYSQQVYSPNFIFLPFLHPLEIYLTSSSFLIFFVNFTICYPTGSILTIFVTPMGLEPMTLTLFCDKETNLILNRSQK